MPRATASRWRRLLFAGVAALVASNAFADASHVRQLAGELRICAAQDPRQPASAFDIARSEPDANGDYTVAYSCRAACDDWRRCQAPAHTASGQPLTEGSLPRQAVAFVVDGMGGHLAFSTRQRGDKTVLLHTGLGGAYYMTPLAAQIEDATSAKTVMVRWERGFANWGWFTRTSPPATRVPNVTRRVASVIAWAHENLAGAGDFGTMGCSMGTQATLGAVYYHDVDAVVDYQLMVGGPALWDINSGCGRRTYATGHCDLDARRACRNDADCARLSPRSRCVKPGPIPPRRLYEQVVNHVHATEACDVAAVDDATRSYAPFDESGFAFVDGDWDFDHPIDFQADLWGPDGDHRWGLGDAMRVFNSIASAAGHAKGWRTTEDSNHCAAIGNGRALELLVAGMGLGSQPPLPPPPLAVGEPLEAVLAANGDRSTFQLSELFAGGEALTFEAASDSPALVAARIAGGALVLEANADGTAGTATVAVTATDRAGQTATAYLRVTLEFARRGFLRDWRSALAPDAAR